MIRNLNSLDSFRSLAQLYINEAQYDSDRYEVHVDLRLGTIDVYDEGELSLSFIQKEYMDGYFETIEFEHDGKYSAQLVQNQFDGGETYYIKKDENVISLNEFLKAYIEFLGGGSINREMVDAASYRLGL